MFLIIYTVVLTVIVVSWAIWDLYETDRKLEEHEKTTVAGKQTVVKNQQGTKISN